MKDLLDYLSKASELAQFCTQNGWIDNSSLKAEVLEERPDSLLLAVTFDEIIMEASGCEAMRQPCYGRVRLTLDGDAIKRIEAL